MRLLLDTNVVFWTVTRDRRLSSAATRHILEAEAIFVSAVSIWEAAIKAALRKLDFDLDMLREGLVASDFEELPVRWRHAEAVRYLPPVHQDPFDRLLVAQAIIEPLHFLTSDTLLARYSDLVIVV